MSHKCVSKIMQMPRKCAKYLGNLRNVQNVSRMCKMSPEWVKCLPALDLFFQMDQFFRWIYLLSGGHHVVIYLYGEGFNSYVEGFHFT